MSNIKGVPENIDDKLFSVKYNPDEESHLVVDQEACSKCKEKPCMNFCPAHVYDWDEEGEKLLVGYENCLECGACRIACPSKTISWRYPKGGCGVTFKCG